MTVGAAVGVAVAVGMAVAVGVAVIVGRGAGGVALSLLRLHAAMKVIRTHISNDKNRIRLKPTRMGACCVPGK